MTNQETVPVCADGATDALPDFAVTFNDVSFTYTAGEPDAVKNLTLSVKRGEFLSVLGHNGSGKSTLARLICGLLTADKGSVCVWGLDPADRKQVNEVRRHAGIVFQNPDNQMVASIVEDDVAFGPENLGVEPSEIVKRVDDSLAAVGMTEYKTATASRLSGGQKQRIAIAGVLAMKPEILILDEATSMLDPDGREDVMSVVKKMNEDGITVINITHDMSEVALSQRVIALKEGEIIFDGTPNVLFDSTEILKRANLDLPPVGKLKRTLVESGIKIEGDTLDEDELAEEIWQSLK